MTSETPREDQEPKKGHEDDVWTPAGFIARCQESFPGVYLTLASIVQGLAMAVLVSEGAGLWNKEDYRLLSVLTGPFLVIVYFWFAFVWSSMFWRHEPNMSDPLILFFVGAIESGLALSVRHPATYLFFAAVLAAVGSLHSIMGRSNHKKHAPKNELANIELRQLGLSISIYSILCIVFTICAVSSLIWRTERPIYVPTGLMVLDVAYWSWQHWRFVKKCRMEVSASKPWPAPQIQPQERCAPQEQ